MAPNLFQTRYIAAAVIVAGMVALQIRYYQGMNGMMSDLLSKYGSRGREHLSVTQLHNLLNDNGLRVSDGCLSELLATFDDERNGLFEKAEVDSIVDAFADFPIASQAFKSKARQQLHANIAGWVIFLVISCLVGYEAQMYKEKSIKEKMKKRAAKKDAESNEAVAREWKSVSLSELRVDNFEFKELMGKGYNGEVHKCQWKGEVIASKSNMVNGEMVAVKKLPKGLVKTLTGVTEQLVMRQLAGMGAVQLKGSFVEGDHYYIVEELCDMGALDKTYVKRLAEGNFGGNAALGVPLEGVLAISLQLLLTLKQLHAAGYEHNDIKPANVFLTKVFSACGDCHIEVKLGDFGKARRSKDETASQFTSEYDLACTAMTLWYVLERGPHVETQPMVIAKLHKALTEAEIRQSALERVGGSPPSDRSWMIDAVVLTIKGMCEATPAAQLINEVQKLAGVSEVEKIVQWEPAYRRAIVAEPGQPLGMSFGSPMSENDANVVSVLGLKPNGFAERSGVLKGDRIIEINGEVFNGEQHLKDALKNSKTQRSVRFAPPLEVHEIES